MSRTQHYSEFNYHLKNIYDKNHHHFHNSSLPIYWHKDENYTSISYLSWYENHKKMIKDCHEKAIVTQEEYNDTLTKNKTIYRKLIVNKDKLVYLTSHESKLYPSKNYIHLSHIIKTHFELSNITESYSVCGLLLDGAPGLGKTKYMDYAVSNKLAGHVYKTDMTTLLNYNFTEVIASMYHGVSITTDTIFMIDEIDKYIEYRINVEYDEMLKSNTKDSFIKTEQEFRNKQKNNFYV